MKRVGNLWPEVVSWGNLLEAALAASRGKRRRPDVARFLADLEPNVCALQRELESGGYTPGGYRTFWIRDLEAQGRFRFDPGFAQEGRVVGAAGGVAAFSKLVW